MYGDSLVSLWESPFTFLNLNFPICKMGNALLDGLLWDQWDTWMWKSFGNCNILCK